MEQVIEEQPARTYHRGNTISTPGNGQLVDNQENGQLQAVSDCPDKEWKYLYMVIDRSGTSENVYMMSLVDENDLAEFLDENEETEKKRNQLLFFRKRLQHQNQKLPYSQKQK